MPRVSIGLPVYNGENYLAEAVQSVLDQTFDDYELVISDNASTDRTAEICQDFSSSDKRVRYFRNERNLGAAPNYNLAWEKSTGEYFKWFAHDDRIKPEYLATTVSALDERPDVILCNTVVDYIGAKGEHLGYYKSVLEQCDVESVSERFSTMILRSHTCVDFFGVLRRKIMEGSLLHQAFSGADKAFLAQMALRGRLLQLEEPLVEMREHPVRYTRLTKTSSMKLAWHDSTQAGKKDIPVLTLYQVYRELVRSEQLNDADRRACKWILQRYWFNWLNAGRLAADLVSVPFPRMVSAAWWIKFRLFGAPGNFVR